MTPTLANILQLSVAERIQLVEDIWDSIMIAPENLHLTTAQRQELDGRLEVYHQTPDANTVWAEAKKRISSSPLRRGS